MTQASQIRVEPDEELQSFQPPEGAAAELDGSALQVNVSSIISIATADFTFRENSNTPGRFLEQTRAVNRPPGSGFFVMLHRTNGAFTTPDFQFLRERPFGQFFVSVGLRADNNLVCRVRLTDSNSDDPILITVGAVIVFFN